MHSARWIGDIRPTHMGLNVVRAAILTKWVVGEMILLQFNILHSCL